MSNAGKSVNLRPSQAYVDSSTIEAMYERYVDDELKVNRRYQRKLVWTLEQKQNLIDSIAKGLPLPLFLLANREGGDASVKEDEIIDGLQRLDAIFSFIENKFQWDGMYFNLKAFAVVNERAENPNDPLVQLEPALDRKTSVAIAKYALPITSYAAASSGQIDEVFRRINSTGRQLSAQDVRQAGITTRFANLVRRIAAEIRGDATKSEILSMHTVSSISIDFGPSDEDGIAADDIFWVKHTILIRDDLRGSADEQLILDILLDLLNMQEGYSSDTRNKAFSPGSPLAQKIEQKLSVEADTIYQRFSAAMTTIESVAATLAIQGQSLVKHTGLKAGNSTARYFLILFLAVDALLANGQQLNSIDELLRLTKDYWREREGLPSGKIWPWERDSGTEGKPGRKAEIEKMRQRIRDAFVPKEGGPTLQLDMKSTFLRDMHNYTNERELFELKIGTFKFSERKLEQQSQRKVIEKILKTSTAMANMGPESEGAIYVGVADSPKSAEELFHQTGIKPITLTDNPTEFDYRIVGLNHELQRLQLDLGEYHTIFTSKIRQDNAVTDIEFKDKLISGIAWLRLDDIKDGDTRYILSIRVPSMERPVEYNQTFYKRSGSECIEVKGMDAVNLLKRFQK